MKIGVLTGGGDCPGLNAAIRAVVRHGIDHYADSFVGFRDGWKGLIEGDCRELTIDNTRGILDRGGTILGSSRTNPFKQDDGAAKIEEVVRAQGIEYLIAIGGEDTLGVASKLKVDGLGIIGVPKTIDNDLSATDHTIGFDTAVSIATEAIDRLHTTAESHHRIMVVEVMGRHAGWIAVHSGIAGGADVVLIPERPFDLDEIVKHLQSRRDRGRTFSIVVAAEGALPREGRLYTQNQELDAFGHPRLGGIGVFLERELEARTGFETRATILGHMQRGGSPTPFDRVLATRLGVKAVDAAHGGANGKMVAIHGTKIDLVPLSEAVDNPKTVGDDLYDVAKVFFG